MRRRTPEPAKEAATFLKQELAEKLREQILRGALIPGQRIVESFWASHFGVAQTSVREAINLLISAGFVTKFTGRSARVTSYSMTDVAEIYQLRGALESLAARLATERTADLSGLQIAVQQMRRAIRRGEIRSLLEADLEFHLRLCEASGNRQLYQQARTLLVPLFAFVSMRVAELRQEAHAWTADMIRHQRIIELIEEGDPATAEFAARAALDRFAMRAKEIWEATPEPAVSRAMRGPSPRRR